MTRLGSPLSDPRSAYLLVGILAALVYLNSLGNQFAYDDVHIIVQNEDIQALETLPGALVTPYWPTAYGRELGLWRPVTTALFGVQYVLGGGSPLIFHVVNLLVHVGVTLLALMLFLELISLPAAFAGAAVFAVHPVHVEAVANIVGLSEIVSTCALLAACIVHLRSGERSGWREALTVGALYAVGFGAKESGVTLPGLIFLLDAVRARLGFRDLPDYLRRRWPVYAVMLGVASALLAARMVILGSVAHPFAPLGADILNEVSRIWTLGEIWLHYIRLWVFPLDLSSDYSPNVLRVWTSWGVTNTVGAAMAMLILLVALLAWRRPHLGPGSDSSKAASFGVVWFMIAISPTSNTVFLSGVLLAERTLYLPSVGLAAATGWLIVRMAQQRRRVAWGALVVMIVGSSVRTWTRNPAWYDTDTVFTVMMTESPQAGRSQWALGDQFMRSGQTSLALQSYRAAITLLDTSYQLITEIARSMISKEYYQGAERLLAFAMVDEPEYSTAYRLMAASRAEQGDAAGTERWAREAIQIQGNTRDVARHHLLAWSLAAQGRWGEATEERAIGDGLARPLFWQGFMYDAYRHWNDGDTIAAYASIDTAWTSVNSRAGREAIDSVRVTEFGLETLRLPVAAVDSVRAGR
jgi:hypothetical protein